MNCMVTTLYLTGYIIHMHVAGQLHLCELVFPIHVNYWLCLYVYRCAGTGSWRINQ